MLLDRKLVSVSLFLDTGRTSRAFAPLFEHGRVGGDASSCIGWMFNIRALLGTPHHQASPKTCCHRECPERIVETPTISIYYLRFMPWSNHCGAVRFSSPTLSRAGHTIFTACMLVLHRHLRQARAADESDHPMGFAVVVCKSQGGVVQLAPPASGPGGIQLQRHAFALLLATQNVFGPNFRSKRCTKRESTSVSALDNPQRREQIRRILRLVLSNTQRANNHGTSASGIRVRSDSLSCRGEKARDSAPCPEPALL